MIIELKNGWANDENIIRQLINKNSYKPKCLYKNKINDPLLAFSEYLEYFGKYNIIIAGEDFLKQMKINNSYKILKNIHISMHNGSSIKELDFDLSDLQIINLINNVFEIRFPDIHIIESVGLNCILSNIENSIFDFDKSGIII